MKEPTVIRETALNSAGELCDPADPDCVRIEIVTLDDDGNEQRTYASPG